ncbi:MAG: hypothetical protein OJF47_000716 [Nitrospira sp.]|jgi:hypothetical protein|nr:MAG: hypothetical protein OJF47_000716 [Nitrospira sp.]
MIGIAAYAAIAGGLFIALWRYPAVALAGVLCMFGLEQWGQATTSFFAQHHTATNLLIGGMLVLALIIQGVRKGFSIFTGYPVVGWLTLALFLYAFASTQWAPRPDISLDIWASRWPYLVTFLILSSLVVTEAKDLRYAFTALILIGGGLSTLLLFFVKWGVRRIVLVEGLGEQGFGSPLAVSAMAGMVVLVAILADPWPHSKLWLPVKWVIVGLSLALIVRSGSRGQLLGVIALSAGCWPLSRGMKNSRQFVAWILLLVFFAGITAWAMQEFWTNRETYYVDGSRWSERAMQGAMSGRLDQAILLVRLWYKTPETMFFGLGNSASFDPRILGIYPHFVPLEILAEEGLVGIAAFLAILFVVTRNALRCYRYVYQVPSERPIVAALIAMFLYSLLLALKQGSLLGNLEVFMFGILLGKYAQRYTAIHHQKDESELSRAPAIEVFSRYPTLTSRGEY